MGDGLSASWALAHDRRRRELACRVVHQRQGAQRALLRLERRGREKLLRSAKIRRRREGALACRDPLLERKALPGLEGVRRRDDQRPRPNLEGFRQELERAARCGVDGRVLRSSAASRRQGRRLSLLVDQGRGLPSAAALAGGGRRGAAARAGEELSMKISRVRRLAGLVAWGFIMGAPAQALEFKSYARGSFTELHKAHAGRPLLVHFWSVTCAPCLAELSDWARIAREKRGIDIVFVNVDGERDHVKA